MNYETFVGYVENELKQHLSNVNSKTSPTDVEVLVKDAIIQVCKTLKIECQVEYVEGGHSFPDIVCRFNETSALGIEVKSSIQPKSNNNSWTILGNSILGSTRVDVDDTYIVFVKLNKNGTFVKCKRYEDAVADIVVTHSPRYKIDLIQNSCDSFFNRSGISYNELKGAENPIGLITNYFKAEGLSAWWLAESSPAVIRTWDEIDDDLRGEIISKAFVLFPELFGSSSVKYKRLAKWLVTNYSITDTSLRDRFSAGGKVKKRVNFRAVLMPQIIHRVEEYRDNILYWLDIISLDELAETWANQEVLKSQNTEDRIKFWLNEVGKELINLDNGINMGLYLQNLFCKIN